MHCSTSAQAISFIALLFRIIGGKKGGPYAALAQTDLLIHHSEDQSQSNLDVAWQIVLARHLAKVGVRGIGVWVGELRMVECIQKLAAQLEPDLFGDREILDHREVPQVQRLAPEAW